MVKRGLKKGLVLSFSFIFLIMSVGGVLSSTEVTNCSDLNQQGEEYTLSASIIRNDLTGPCITISADDIIFICYSSIIRSNNTEDGVYVTANNVTVVDCDISMNETGGGQGIHLNGADDATLYSNTLNNNTIGLKLENSDNAKIYINTIDYNSDKGIYLTNSDGNEIYTTNDVKYNVYGIYLETSNDNIIYDNSLDAGESKIINYWVNATGSLGSYRFFAYVNLTSDPSVGDMSDEWFVDII